jgi:hypothetical protein
MAMEFQDEFEDDFPRQAIRQPNSAVRVISVVLSALTIACSVVMLIVAAIIAFFEHGYTSHVGYLTSLTALSCVVAILGAILIILRLQVGLWVYLAGQAAFIFVVGHGIYLESQRATEELSTLFAALLIAMSLCGAVLQAIFVPLSRK